MSFTLVGITGTVNIATGAGIVGVAGATVTATLSGPIGDGTTVIEQGPITVVCDGSGAIPSGFELPANDDSSTVPTGSYWKFVISGSTTAPDGASTSQPVSFVDTFFAVLPHASYPTVDLFSLARLASAPGAGNPYVASIEGLNGTVGVISPDSSVGIATSGSDLELTANSGGQTPVNPLAHASVEWAFVSDPSGGIISIPAYTYANGTLGVGATMTANAHGTLSINGGSPSLGDRVVVADNHSDDGTDGIYTVTNLGSGSTSWVLTRATDCDVAATLLEQFWCVEITADPLFVGGFARLCSVEPGTPTVGTTHLSLDVVGPYNATTAGAGAAIAFGTDSLALGQGAVVYAPNGTAVGSGCIVTGSGATATGQDVVASGTDSLATGTGSLSYAAGQCAEGTANILTQGDSQFSRAFLAVQTTNATPTAATNEGTPFQFAFANTNPDFTRTVLMQGRVVARRIDTPGTDSVWTFQGVARGDGTSTYTWVGGSAPTMTLVAQDAAASTWAAAVAFDVGTKNQLDVTVTGQASKTINWTVIIELFEVAG